MQKSVLAFTAVISVVFLCFGCGKTPRNTTQFQFKLDEAQESNSVRSVTFVGGEVIHSNIRALTNQRSLYPMKSYEFTVMNPDGIENKVAGKVFQKFNVGDKCYIENSVDLQVIGELEKKVLVRYLTKTRPKWDYCPEKTIGFVERVDLARLKSYEAGERERAARAQEKIQGDLWITKKLLAEEQAISKNQQGGKENVSNPFSFK